MYSITLSCYNFDLCEPM